MQTNINFYDIYVNLNIKLQFFIIEIFFIF